MRPLDIAFMKAVHHKVNIVPVIAKADTLTKQEVTLIKSKVMGQIEEHGITIYPLPDCDSDEDEDYREQCRQLKVGQIICFLLTWAECLSELYQSQFVRRRVALTFH